MNEHALQSSVLFRTAKEDFAVLLRESSTSLLGLWFLFFLFLFNGERAVY